MILFPVYAGMFMNSGRIVVDGMFWKKRKGRKADATGRQTVGGGESSSESAKWEEGEITQRMSAVILAGG